MSSPLVKKLRESLVSASDQKTKDSGKRFFKEAVKMHGVNTKKASAINAEFFALIKDLPKKEFLALCEEIFADGYSEEAWIVASWLAKRPQEFEERDLTTFEHWIDAYIDNWAKCDTLCNHAVGDYMMMYPHKIPTLYRWATSPNLWVRRAAAVTLIIPAKRGKCLDEVFKIADLLLTDSEDLVQKGYGWLLKEASREHQKDVFDYVCAHKATMPRTALRYAIEKMPQELRKEAMKK